MARARKPAKEYERKSKLWSEKSNNTPCNSPEFIYSCSFNILDNWIHYFNVQCVNTSTCTCTHTHIYTLRRFVIFFRSLHFFLICHSKRWPRAIELKPIMKCWFQLNKWSELTREKERETKKCKFFGAFSLFSFFIFIWQKSPHGNGMGVPINWPIDCYNCALDSSNNDNNNWCNFNEGENAEPL